MRKISLICLLFVGLAANAKEDLGDFYVMQPREHDKLFFILPIEMSEVSKKERNAEFDITHITSAPTSTVNISIYAKQNLHADSIVFSNRERRIAVADFKTFFIEKEKQIWKHRYSCAVSFADLCGLYKEASPWELTVYHQSGRLVYRQSPSVWERARARMTEILYLIQLNSAPNDK